jgi:hypothetical protein
MCSIVDQARGTSRGPRLHTLIAHTRELSEAITADLLDPDAPADLTALHVDAVAAQLRDLLTVADQARAAAAVLTGVVDLAVAGRELIEGTYASTKRFLEVEAGLAPRSATALAARARDLRDAADGGDPRLRYAWLAGALSDDKVRELTLGIQAAVKHHPAGERDRLTSQALDLLLPLAPTHTVAQLKRALARLRFVLDPDGVRQAELDAYTEQSLSCVRVGHLMVLRAVLDPEAAAAVMTVLSQQVDSWCAAGDLAVEDRLPDGVDPDSAEGRRHQRARTGHLLALALGEVMTGLLDRSEVGLHHGIRPHTVLHVDARDLIAGLGGELTMPGHDDPVLLSSDTVRRILCDTGLTHVITQPAGCQSTNRTSTGTGAAAGTDLPDLLREHAVDVLYVGREYRTAPPRLRRALEARDRHCQAPGCGRHPRRCNAHHVQHWEHGGDTTIANCLLLCDRHHRALHSGALTITRNKTKRPTESGYFRVHPPDRPTSP